MNRKLTTAALALALGLAWTAAPAMAQSTTDKMKDKAETAKDKVEDKARDVKDTIKEKASDVKDKVESKTHRAKDKSEDAVHKTSDKGESVMDKTKDKMTDMKDKVKDKMHRTTAKRPSADITSMQTALKDKGFDPGPIDGRMGPRTKTALREYQKKEGLNATGRWDDETANRLGVRTSKVDTTQTPGAAGKEPATGAVSASPATPTGEEHAAPSKRAAP
jgi:hypothetical protein